MVVPTGVVVWRLGAPTRPEDTKNLTQRSPSPEKSPDAGRGRRVVVGPMVSIGR